MTANRSYSLAWRKGQSTGWKLFLLVVFTALVRPVSAAETKTVIFFGDSLTAGYGVEPDEAYPALIQRKIDEAKLPWRVVNAGLSGETTSGGLRRLDWILRQQVDIFVIELGGNDGLRGIDPALSQSNLNAMITRIRQHYPAVKVVVAGMQLPTNMGFDYTHRFAAIFPEVARTGRATLIPFLLDRVGGVPTLNQPDGIHPTPEGHQIVADTVWRTLQPLF